MPLGPIGQLFRPIMIQLMALRLDLHPQVSSLMSGVFNQRPPKYSFIWDVETLLKYILKPCH